VDSRFRGVYILATVRDGAVWERREKITRCMKRINNGGGGWGNRGTRGGEERIKMGKEYRRTQAERSWDLLVRAGHFGSLSLSPMLA
jgi:hypothetical protein